MWIRLKVEVASGRVSQLGWRSLVRRQGEWVATSLRRQLLGLPRRQYSPTPALSSSHLACMRMPDTSFHAFFERATPGSRSLAVH